MAELKPCPFCGGKAIFFDRRIADNIKSYSVCCVCCTARITGFTNKELAELNWNTRANEKGGAE